MPKRVTIPVTSFTSRYKGLSPVLLNDVGVSSKIFQTSESKVDKKDIPSLLYKALWDTGATNCVITQKVVDELNLKPTGMKKVHTASHTVDAEVYMVSIFLPNRVCMPNIHVTKGNITGHDMLIGMDVINQGDFAVSNHNGKTVFSFRMPSLTEIDYTKKPEHETSSKISRNSPCPCGSGKKYKKCCGKA